MTCHRWRQNCRNLEWNKTFEMKKALSILFLLLFGIALNTSAQTADKAAQRVAALSDAVKALGNYVVRFTIEIGEHRRFHEHGVRDSCPD